MPKQVLFKATTLTSKGRFAKGDVKSFPSKEADALCKLSSVELVPTKKPTEKSTEKSVDKPEKK